MCLCDLYVCGFFLCVCLWLHARRLKGKKKTNYRSNNINNNKKEDKNNDNRSNNNDTHTLLRFLTRQLAHLW